jgi:hypothetical protein
MLRWNWSFWGGTVAMTGGALVIGALARLPRDKTSLNATLLGIALFILAISRPFEGAVFITISLLLMLRKREGEAPAEPGVAQAPRLGRSLALPMRSALALGVTIATGLAWIGYDNWRVTGNALRLPYREYESQYGITPPFIWLPSKRVEPVYRHAAMRDYNIEWELKRLYQRQRTPRGLANAMLDKTWDFSRSYLASPVLVAAVGIALFTRAGRSSRLLRRALLASVVFTLVVFGNLSFFPHYAAPGAILYLLLFLESLRLLRPRPIVLFACVALHLCATAYAFAHLDRSSSVWNYSRAALIRDARQAHRKLLVIVRPGPGYQPQNEWVYNDADIDASQVVWARDMGAANKRLLDYFRERERFVLEVNATTARLVELPR